jgi:hypothetical protein
MVACWPLASRRLITEDDTVLVTILAGSLGRAFPRSLMHGTAKGVALRIPGSRLRKLAWATAG